MKLKLPNLTWRTRKRLKVTALVLGSVLAVSIALWLCWILWLGRFVVYSREGVRLDFDWVTPGAYVTAVPPEEPPVVIRYDDGSEPVADRAKELEQLNGFRITLDMLTGDLTELGKLVREQPKGTAFLLELKSGTGNFYYDTDMPNASISSKADTKAIAELIAYLTKADYYTIAAVPALRDRAFGLKNTAYGIHHSSGRYLWAGDDKCYWLDPVKNGTRTRLIDIATELRELGFDEVLFTDFCFPPTTDILYEGDQLKALNETAQHLVYNLATEDFCVSFLCSTEGFLLPEGRSRLYRNDVSADLAQSVASTLSVPNPQINLVYLTEVNDTRFNAYGVLRPLPLGVTTQLPPAVEPVEVPSQEEPAVQPDEAPVE